MPAEPQSGPEQPVAPASELALGTRGAAAVEARRSGRRALQILAGLLLLLALLVVLLVAGLDIGPIALATGLVLAVVPVPVYVWVALRIDRFEPEPLPMLAWAFFWGASGAAFIALMVNSVGQAVVGDSFGSDVGELYGSSISAPVVEETAKAAILFGIYRWRRAEFDGVLDGIVYAAMVGLGFAMTENVLYYGHAAVEGGVPLAATFFLRGVMAPFVHPVFTAMTGIGLGIAATSTRRPVRILAPAGGLLAAITLHSLWNTAAGVSGGGAFFGVYALIMVPIFALLVVVVVLQLRTEGRTVALWLSPEVAAGVLSASDVATLSSLRERRRASRAARAAGGRALQRQRRTFDAVATTLAFRRARGAKGLPLDVADPAAADAAGLARLAELRAALPAPPPPRGSAPAWPAAAPVSGGPGRPAASAPAVFQAPPGWYPDPWRAAAWRWWDGRQWTGHAG
jgi:protease PrsW